MKEVSTLCKSNGESLGSVLGECCCLNGNAGCEAREVVVTTFVQAAFSKVLPEEAWDERVKALRVPDWHYLLFKLKSKTSDSAWQDLINLTKLGKQGEVQHTCKLPARVNLCQFCCLITHHNRPNS